MKIQDLKKYRINTNSTDLEVLEIAKYWETLELESLMKPDEPKLDPEVMKSNMSVPVIRKQLASMVEKRASEMLKEKYGKEAKFDLVWE